MRFSSLIVIAAMLAACTKPAPPGSGDSTHTPPPDTSTAPPDTSAHDGALSFKVAATTPHFKHLVVSYPDFYSPYHPKDTLGIRAVAGRSDYVNSGSNALWKGLDSTIKHTVYRLYWNALDSSAAADMGGTASVPYAENWLKAHSFIVEHAFLHQKDSTADSTHRIWYRNLQKTQIYEVFNPADSGFRAFQNAQLDSILKLGNDGIFYDEFGRGGMAIAFKSTEGDSTWYQKNLHDALAQERNRFPKAVIVVNTASYDTPFDSMCVVTAGGTQLERTNYPLGGNEARYMKWVEHLVTGGARYIEYVSNLAWTDNLPKQYNAGNDTTARALEKMSEYEAYLLVKDTAGAVTFNADNYWNESPLNHWLKAWDANIGQPLAARYLFTSGKDPLKQSYSVFARDYPLALVMLRVVVPDYDSLRKAIPEHYGDSTAVTIHLTKLYRLLRSDGVLSAPESTINLRAGEGAILLK